MSTLSIYVNLRGLFAENCRLVLRLVKNPAHHPPVLEEMMADIERVISGVASQYTDQSCQFLHHDNLVGEGRLKLAKIIDGGWLQKLPTRGEFFKWFKAVVNNHVKGMVHKYRFTFKRTGVKAPPQNRDGKFDPDAVAPVKNVELSLDDPDSHVQVEDEQDSSGAGGASEAEFMRDIQPLLTPIEQMVLKQVTEPNEIALLLATLDAQRGRAGGKEIKIKTSHQAEGLGLTEEVFETVLSGVRQKVASYMSADSDHSYNLKLAQLEELFGLQIPRSIADSVVRRLLTIAARDQASKVTPEIAELLVSIGAKPPEIQGGSLTCYGILYSRTERTCANCGLRASCSAEAANVGLGEITIAPTLLGAKQTRVPALTGGPAETKMPSFMSERDEHVFDYLQEHFQVIPLRNEVYFRPRDFDGSMDIGTRVDNVSGLIFAFDEQSRFRFCKPSEDLQQDLTRIKNAHYLPPTCSVEKALALVQRHAEETFAVA